MTEPVSKLEKLPCPICGGLAYSWGNVVANGLTFKSIKASWLSKMVSAGWDLPARICDACGNIQVFSSSTPIPQIHSAWASPDED